MLVVKVLTGDQIDADYADYALVKSGEGSDQSALRSVVMYQGETSFMAS